MSRGTTGPSLLTLCAVGAAGIGAVIGARYLGSLHRHTCPKCGATWSHASGGAPEHRCPSCGTEERFKSAELSVLGWKSLPAPTQEQRDALTQHMAAHANGIKAPLPEALAMGRA